MCSGTHAGFFDSPQFDQSETFLVYPPVCNDQAESTFLVVMPRNDGAGQIQDHARRSVGLLFS